MQETSNRLAFIAGLIAIFGAIAMCGGLAFKMDQRATDQLIGIAGVVAVIILLCATSIAIALIFSRRTQAVTMTPPQIEVHEPQTKQIAARMDFLDTGRGQLVDSSRVEQMAFQIVHRCKGVEWTYENIKAHTGETNNRLIQQGLDLLTVRGQVSVGGQGRKRVRTAPQPAETQG